MADLSTKVVYAALAGNVLVAAAKFGAATVSGSSAMLTEAIHSAADSANQVLLLIGNKRSRAEADASHAFGYGMEIYFWAFVVAVMVLLVGGVASIYAGVQHVLAPAPIASPALSLGVLGVSLLFEASSLAVGYRAYKRVVRGRRIDGKRIGLWHFIKLSKDPNMYESLLEDSAALIGIGIAAIGVAANAYLNVLWADGLASIAIGALLVADSALIALATRSLIAGEAASPLALQDIERALAQDRERTNVSKVMTLQLGPRTILVTLTVGPDDRKTLREVTGDLEAIVKRLQAADERIRHVFFRFE